MSATQPKTESASDAFYVGYLPTTSPVLARWLRSRVLWLVLITGLVPVALVWGMRPFSSAVFEFGELRTFTGELRADPYPRLLVERPSAPAGSTEPAYSSYLLVAEGKFGAGPELEQHVGSSVSLSGTLIYRDGHTLVELAPGSLQVQAEESPARATAEVDHGTRRLTGEIVDSKCFLGVMKPGDSKPHRACATRCISGGVPPVLLVRDDAGLASYYLLVGPGGTTMNRAVLGFVAEPVAITGRVVTRGDQAFLYADPAAIERLP